jgi:hypothetical protein
MLVIVQDFCAVPVKMCVPGLKVVPCDKILTRHGTVNIRSLDKNKPFSSPGGNKELIVGIRAEFIGLDCIIVLFLMPQIYSVNGFDDSFEETNTRPAILLDSLLE